MRIASSTRSKAGEQPAPAPGNQRWLIREIRSSTGHRNFALVPLTCRGLTDIRQSAQSRLGNECLAGMDEGNLLGWNLEQRTSTDGGRIWFRNSER